MCALGLVQRGCVPKNYKKIITYNMYFKYFETKWKKKQMNLFNQTLESPIKSQKEFPHIFLIKQ